MFFEMLESSAQEAHNSVHALVKLSQALDQPVGLEEFARSRRRDKEITGTIRNAIYTTFVTALEREDIESLCNALYRIPKTVEKFGERTPARAAAGPRRGFFQAGRPARSGHRLRRANGQKPPARHRTLRKSRRSTTASSRSRARPTRPSWSFTAISSAASTTPSRSSC